MKPNTPPPPHPLYRRALRQQRQQWRRQHGRPPIPLSRQNHPWQPWEVAWLQTPSLPSLPILSIWLGRPPAEIQEQLLAIIEELQPEKKNET